MNNGRMTRISRAAVFLAVILSSSPIVAQETAPGGENADLSPNSDIQLVSETASVRPGEPFHVALHLTMDAGWHTYWVNAGDAGLPLFIEWDLPEGFTAGAIQWPTPRLIPEPPLASYAYEGQLFLPVEITPPADLAPGESVRLAGATDFLVCADICLPASGAVSLELPVASGPPEPDPDWGATVADTRARIPGAPEGWRTRAWTTDEGYVFEVAPGADGSDNGARQPSRAPASLEAPYLFVDSMNVVHHGAPQSVARMGDTIRILIPRNEFALEDVGRLGGILVARMGAEASQAWQVDADITREPPGAAPLLASETQATGGVAAAMEEGTAGSATSNAGELGLLLALLFAFVGGLILNLMPCVFPVLSVKILGFVEHGNEDAARGKRHGLVFAAGVLVSFWILAGLLLALRAGGESLGWGFQLQSPAIVATVALLLFGLGLNLSGVFEIGLGLTRLGGASAENGYADSFLTGGLTVLVATPCTAPFMGAALGFALVQPPAVGLGVFTALALGLAAPYVALSFAPALLRRLPRPGAWMETMRQGLAFPLYATVVWLVWVFGRQAGIDATALLLFALTVFALGAWLYGRSMAPGRSRLMRAAAVVALVAAGALAVQGTLLAELPSAGSDELEMDGDGAPWQAFSPTRVEELRASGRAVFIDFTAAWCLSCQVNERIALQTDRVRAVFARENVALVKADWTNRDPVIADAIEAFGRSGVPLYVIYPASGGEADILPAVLTPGIVVEAVERAVGDS